MSINKVYNPIIMGKIPSCECVYPSMRMRRLYEHHRIDGKLQFIPVGWRCPACKEARWDR
jgi:hypothetical protein